DYSSFSKPELIAELKKAQQLNPPEAYSIAKKVKHAVDEIHSSEESEALDKFLEDGGDKDSFEFKDHDYDVINEYYKKIKDVYIGHSNEVKSQREHNFKAKETLLNTLRDIVNQEETQDSHQKVKKLQEEWKSIGQVPADKAQDLYGSYAALLNRYYDQQSIYYQFKELDRRKNLEIKTKICEKAEELVKTESVTAALKELSELHSEYKSIGPVPKENQEELWNRLKTASEALYQKRKEYQENLEGEYAKNLELKQQILNEVEVFSNFQSNKAEAWQKKTAEITAIKEKWAKIGFVSKDKSKEINKAFWAQYKKFFHNKGDFFKSLHEERQNNLALKLQLCEQVDKILEQGEVNENSIEEVKGLQRKWKEVGPTFYKKGNEVYEKFKSSCDKFFDLKRGNDSSKEKEFEINLEKKNAYAEQVEQATEVQDFDKLLSGWEALGLVPRKDIGSAKSRFLKAWEAHVDKLVKDPNENARLKLKAQVSLLKDSTDGKNKLYQKEKNIKNKITHLENDIATLTNNLEFFARSKNADALKSDVLKKIEESKKELEKLKQQYKLLRAM
ncbi:MAG TPA: DUF349 domain-containing protein, partial [Cytophagales bacterium]|nr:DUF349 domain-containing protein [Cytophagales bacterium]